jgi:hypothetical protein
MANWAYRDSLATGQRDLVGYKVEAADGSIGKIDEASDEAGAAYVVVDTGPWIFGKKRLIPAGVIERIDVEGELVYVGMTKDQIKNAPDFDETHRDDRGSYDEYYSAY